MILKDIKYYLKLNGESKLSDIAKSLKTNVSFIEMGIEQWLRKGKVARRENFSSCGGGCGGCGSSCSTSSLKKIQNDDYYSWVG